MSETIEDILQAFYAEMQQTEQRYTPFIQRAEEAGHQPLARLLRAMVASEKSRNQLARPGMINHARDEIDYYVCPHCGLIFAREAPEQCPVDETAAADFEKIS